MDREFLDLYNRELLLLYEQAGEFAQEYPGIAERLGGLVADHGIHDRRCSRGCSLSCRPGAAEAQTRISGVYEQPARATYSQLSCADAIHAPGAGSASLCRPCFA